MPTCGHLWATDYRWWKHHIADVARDFDGLCWTQDVQWDDKNCVSAEQWGIRQLKAKVDGKGLSRTPGIVHTGRNGGYAGIGVAYTELKAQRILLLGYDMQMQGDRRHFFGAHPPGLEVASDYGQFIGCFQTIRPEDYGIEIWNLTRRTALQHFPLHDLDQVCAALS